MEIIGRTSISLSLHLDQRVEVITRQEWDDANKPDGSPTRLGRPLTPFRGVESTGKFISAVVSGHCYTESPGSHSLRYDPDDYPKVINIDSQNWVLDLPR